MVSLWPHPSIHHLSDLHGGKSSLCYSTTAIAFLIFFRPYKIRQLFFDRVLSPVTIVLLLKSSLWLLSVYVFVLFSMFRTVHAPACSLLQNWLYCICHCGTGRCAVCVAVVSWHSPTNRIYHSFHVSKSFHSSFKINSVFLLEWHFLVLSPMETIHPHLLFFTLGCDTNSRGLWWDQWCAVCQHPP